MRQADLRSGAWGGQALERLPRLPAPFLPEGQGLVLGEPAPLCQGEGAQTAR